jgi:hypothetical protein
MTNKKCRTEGCDQDPDDGEGWDGYCGSCADKLAIEDGKEQNARRAAWAEEAVNVFGLLTYGGRNFTETVKQQPGEQGDAYTMIQDLIGDCLHLVVKHGWDPDELLKHAKSNFDHENSPDYMGD